MRRTAATGCLVVLGVLLVLGLAARGWYWYRSLPSSPRAVPASPVNVFLVSPIGGAEVKAGDVVPVRAQAIAPQPIQSAELFVDGQSHGAVTDSPEDASWTWQAMAVGVHTLYTKATEADGQAGQSQTVIINVLAGNGTIQVPASGGQTLQQVGGNFGVPPEQMGGANPHLDPNKPLQDGQPVNVPLPGGGGAGGGEPQPPTGGGGNNPALITILWKIKFTQPVDQSYCYTSSGNGVWDKLPKDPFSFFERLDSLYTQLIPPAQHVVLQVDCWGWLAGALKYLGQGQTSFDINQPPPNLVIAGPGFQFAGTPQIPVTEKPLGGGVPAFPPPYAVREPSDAADCTAHSNPLLAGFICKTILNAPLKTYTVLEWEWQPAFCWPGYCNGPQAVDGYRVYGFDPVAKSENFIKQVDNGSQKTALVPLGWAGACYGVRAYVNSPTYMESELTIYCPGQPPNTQYLGFVATQWATRGGAWIDVGDCPSTDYFKEGPMYHGINLNSGSVLVGSFIHEGGDCDLRQGDYSAAVRFGINDSPGKPDLPAGTILQKAVLKWSTEYMEYGATHVAMEPQPDSCASNLGTALEDWNGLSSGDHYATGNIWLSPAHRAPFTSIGSYQTEVDVTPVVAGWLKHPDKNHGFILTPMQAVNPVDVEDNGGSGECISWLHNFGLDVYYYAP